VRMCFDLIAYDGGTSEVQFLELLTSSSLHCVQLFPLNKNCKTGIREKW